MGHPRRSEGASEVDSAGAPKGELLVQWTHAKGCPARLAGYDRMAEWPSLCVCGMPSWQTLAILLAIAEAALETVDPD